MSFICAPSQESSSAMPWMRGYLVISPRPRGADVVPVSFDQDRHVSFGSRPGSWMAVAFTLDSVASLDVIAQAWDAVVQRHETLRSVFATIDDHAESESAVSESAESESGGGAEAPDSSASTQRCGGPQTDLVQFRVPIAPGSWEQIMSGDPAESWLSQTQIKEALRAHFDQVCDPFAVPSHRLCVVHADEATQVIIGSDHAHVDAWSLLVLVRDVNACIQDINEGRTVGEDLPSAPGFSAHTAALEQKPYPPVDVMTRWRDLMDASGGAMPVFPLPLGDLSSPLDEVVEVRDVLDSDELAVLEEFAARGNARVIGVAVSVLTEISHRLAGQPLRTVFPVHSREDPQWYNSVGWFITNAILANDDAELGASYAAVKDAIVLGSHPLAPIMRPFGGMPATAGMFAISWLDHRKLPIALNPAYDPQHISAVIRTDGVMVWFVVNDTGLHLRCRYPDTAEARESVTEWLGALVTGLREPVSL